MPFRYLILSLLLSTSFTFLTAQENQFTSFDGNTIAYSDDGDGYPILLLHGFLNKGENWRGSILYRELLAAGYRVIVPDLRGNGKSVRTLDESIYQDDAEVKDLLALAGHLKLKKYYAVGYSRGSIVLGELITQDKRIKKAVFGGMGIDFTDAEWSKRKAFAAAFIGTESLDEMTKGAVNYAKTIDVDLPIMGWLQAHQPSTSTIRLSKFKRPVLVLVGDEDQENGDTEELAKVFKKGKLKVVPGDHNTTYRKQPFAKMVLDFL